MRSKCFVIDAKSGAVRIVEESKSFFAVGSRSHDEIFLEKEEFTHISSSVEQYPTGT